MDDAHYSRVKRVLPAAAIAIPVVWAVATHAVGSSPRPMAAARPRPALAFAQRLVDLGEVGPSEEVFAHFDFINRGNEDVRIDELVPSCGCLQPELKKRLYHPRQSGQFLLRVQTANQTAGAKEYTVTVKYHDPEPRETDVVFRVELPENQVFVRPRSLELTSLGSTAATIQKVEIIDRREEPLSIARIECNRRGIVEIGQIETHIADTGYTHHRFDVTFPAELPEGRTEAVLWMYTDDREYRVLRVPIRIDNRPAPPIADKSRQIVDPAVRPAQNEVVNEPARGDGDRPAAKVRRPPAP